LTSFLSTPPYSVNFSMKWDKKSERLNKSEELYNICSRMQRNDVEKRRHQRKLFLIMITKLRTVDAGFEHKSQKMIALTNLHSESWAQNKTMIYS
jgi:hypothetical protein